MVNSTLEHNESLTDFNPFFDSLKLSFNPIICSIYNQMNKSSFKCFLHFILYPSSFPYSIQAFKALNKLSRNKAILEFSGLNGYVSFSVNFECRNIYLIEDEIQNHFSYLVGLPFNCAARNYEQWELNSNYCITTFQGKKCSMM